MTALLAEYPLLRLGLLLGLFALVVAGAYFVTAAMAARQLSRRRLVEGPIAVIRWWVHRSDRRPPKALG